MAADAGLGAGAVCAGKRAVLVVEEGAPDYIEQAIHALLRKRDVDTKIYGSEIYNLDNTIIGDGLLPIPMAMGQHCCVGGMNRLRCRIQHMGNNNQIENIRLFVHHGKAVKCCSSCAMGRKCDCNGGHK